MASQAHRGWQPDSGSAWAYPFGMKVETILAELNRQRSDLPKDPTDIEWFALHHAFCFISYRMGDFQKYLDEVVKPNDPKPE
jgi:hypothetical protein